MSVCLKNQFCVYEDGHNLPCYDHRIVPIKSSETELLERIEASLLRMEQSLERIAAVFDDALLENIGGRN